MGHILILAWNKHMLKCCGVMEIGEMSVVQR